MISLRKAPIQYKGKKIPPQIDLMREISEYIKNLAQQIKEIGLE